MPHLGGILMKKAFAILLIYTTISVLFGQDLNYQLDTLSEKYGINIKGGIRNTINEIVGYEMIQEDAKEK